MFVVTFYSFKGGVGRTMAVVNTSVALAKAGRRVLVVDFDLEAPGLSSYEVFQQANDCRGVVDYVTTYRTTGAAPDVSDYISTCDVDGTSIWVMPAGCHTKPGYNEALNSIDWQDLYEHQDGYLMFEDLKQQWANFDELGFDYVLIDSRTGHTDVGGICTRQLPDAVAIMFLPNDQNIDGLVPIVSAIKEGNKSRQKKIMLEFFPSNVPDLDDEKDILSSQLARAKQRLGYKREPSIVHHYASFDVLAQKAFVIARPNSKLSKEYEKMRASIVALNFDDPEGARVTLNRLPSDYDRGRRLGRSDVWSDVRTKALDIRSRHPGNGEIAFLAARVFTEIGDPAEEIEALTSAIDLNYEINRSRLARAFAYASISRQSEAILDMREIAMSPTASIFELGPAMQVLQEIDNDWVGIFASAVEMPNRDFSTIDALVQRAFSHRKALPVIANVMERQFNLMPTDAIHRSSAKNSTVLAMIGSGQFVRAMAFIKPDPDLPMGDFDLIDLFNYATASWGTNGRPDIMQFNLCLQKFESSPGSDVNFYQCLALTEAVVGNIDGALKAISEAQNQLDSSDMDFSCWRYLYVDAATFAADLNAMHDQIKRGDALVPEYLCTTPTTHLH